MIRNLAILSLIILANPAVSQIKDRDPRLKSLLTETNTDTVKKIKLRFERAIGLYYIFYDLSGEQIVLQFRDSRFEKNDSIKQFQPGRPYLVEFKTRIKGLNLPNKTTKSIQYLEKKLSEGSVNYGEFINAQDLVLDRIRH